jgi:Ca-activated chloride channel homolog
MIRSTISAGAVCLLTLSFIAALPAQNNPKLQQAPGVQSGQKPPDDGNFTLNVNVQLVQIPVTVTSKDGKLVDNLPQSSFQVFEDNVQQEITLFKHEDVPLSLGLVIDNSGSMRNKRQRVNSAALTFVRESNPDDETFIVDFDDEAVLRQQFTRSMADLVDALADINTQGETALNDAVYLSLDQVRTGSRDKKALLLISDGEDNKSKYGINKLLEHIKESRDVTIYAIGLLEENDDRGGLFSKSPSKRAKEDLTKIAEITGGEAYFPKTVDEVSEICKHIARDLRNQYTLGYSPKNTKTDGGDRTIRVNVTPPAGVSKINVRAKTTYKAPNP